MGRFGSIQTVSFEDEGVIVDGESFGGAVKLDVGVLEGGGWIGWCEDMGMETFGCQIERTIDSEW